jgi:hypothetical protein
MEADLVRLEVDWKIEATKTPKKTHKQNPTTNCLSHIPIEETVLLLWVKEFLKSVRNPWSCVFLKLV